MATAGFMQDRSLTVGAFLDFAARWHPTVPVVGRLTDGVIGTSDDLAICGRARRVPARLLADGVRPGDRAGTLAVTSIRHLESWHGIMGIGAVCHTINLRLFRDQLVSIFDHAGGQMLFADAGFRDLAIELLEDCPTIKCLVILPDGSDLGRFGESIDYEPWLDNASAELPAWGGFDERRPCGLCYTSGTTSDPRGVLYSHRSNYLHALSSLQPDVLALSATDRMPLGATGKPDKKALRLSPCEPVR